MRPTQPTRMRGFSLLEVLVAFTVLSVSLGALLHVFSNGVKGAALSEDYTRAAILADAKLGEMAVQQPLTLGQTSGKTPDGWRWFTEVSDYPMAEAADTQALNPARLYRIQVSVQWPTGRGNREFHLATLRFAPEGD